MTSSLAPRRYWRRRLTYLTCAVVVVPLGLGSRRFGTHLPAFIAAYAGDTLWALMVFLGVGVIVPQVRNSSRAAIAIVVSYAVEVSQIFHAPWIDALRHTTLGSMVLGFGFLWSDLVCYALGVATGASLEYAVRRSVASDLQKRSD